MSDRPWHNPELAAEIHAVLDGYTLLVNVSGGKDSSATVLYLQEMGLPYIAVMANTGWEHPATIDYVTNVLPKWLGKINLLETPGMYKSIQDKAMFPSRLRRFCTTDLKVKPIVQFANTLNKDAICNVIGVRSQESKARSLQNCIDDVSDAGLPWDLVWKPLFYWPLSWVLGIHKYYGLPLNPLYNQGASRVGCWPCIFSRKAEIRMVADTDPDRIDLIRSMERKLSKPDRPYTYFQNPQGIRGADGKKIAYTPIDDVVAWSRTKRGGKEFEPFVPDLDGCARWGFCDFNVNTEGEP